jgi:Polyketide cyclase / dehydrase and lipid transport
MRTFEVSIPISASPEDVWNVLCDVKSWADWSPTVDNIDCLDSTLLCVGSRYRVFQPKLRPAIWTVTSMDPPLGFAWTATSPGMTMTADHVVSKIGPGMTELTLSFVFEGWLGAIMGRIFGRIVKDYLAKECQALRQQAERGCSTLLPVAARPLSIKH